MTPLMPFNALPRGTSRILLRRLVVADLPTFQAYRHDPDVGRYQGWQRQSDDDATRFLAQMSAVDNFPPGAWVQLGIARRTTNELIGDVGVCVGADGERAEVGFTIVGDAQGARLGTEAVRLLVSIIFEHTHVAAIVAITDERNVPAHRLLRKVGMRQVETVRTVFRGRAVSTSGRSREPTPVALRVRRPVKARATA